MNTIQKILIIDKERSIRKSLLFELEDHGFCGYEAASRDEALVVMRDIQPNIIIIDLPLRELEEAVLFIQEMRYHFPRSIILGMMTLYSWDIFEKALSAGAEYCITKGFTIRELVSLLFTIIQKRNRSQ